MNPGSEPTTPAAPSTEGSTSAASPDGARTNDVEGGPNPRRDKRWMTTIKKFLCLNGDESSGDQGSSAEPAEKKSFGQICKAILFNSCANYLLIFIPVGIAVHFLNVPAEVVFTMNFLAIVPLAAVSFSSGYAVFAWRWPSFCFLRRLC